MQYGSTVTDLFQAVIESPEDTVLRLVVADALEEAGDEDRANFIRIQCELASDPIVQAEKRHQAGIWKIDSLKRIKDLRRRERDLLRFYATNWLPEIDGLAKWRDDTPGPIEGSQPLYGWLSKKSGQGALRVGATFSRGFIELVCVSLPFETWDELGQIMVNAAPLMSVRFSNIVPIAWPHAGGFAWSEHIIPTKWFTRLGKPVLMAGIQYQWFPTVDAAWAELSRVALEEARS